MVVTMERARQAKTAKKGGKDRNYQDKNNRMASNDLAVIPESVTQNLPFYAEKNPI